MLPEPGHSFDAPDRVQVNLLASLPAARRVRAMLDARELVMGLMRGRLRRCFPDLSIIEINLKALEELSRAEQRASRS
jgi:hypothetical protein